LHNPAFTKIRLLLIIIKIYIPILYDSSTYSKISE
jgi:hypothetical protein